MITTSKSQGTNLIRIHPSYFAVTQTLQYGEDCTFRSLSVQKFKIQVTGSPRLEHNIAKNKKETERMTE